jgi:hypothetical protein
LLIVNSRLPIAKKNNVSDGALRRPDTFGGRIIAERVRMAGTDEALADPVASWAGIDNGQPFA